MTLDLLLITRDGVTKLLPDMPQAPPELHFPLVEMRYFGSKWGDFAQVGEPMQDSEDERKLLVFYEQT